MTIIEQNITKPIYESRDKFHLEELMYDVWEYAEAKFREKYPTLKPPFLTCTYRSKQAQNDLYKIGRTKIGKVVTHAKGGQSPHNYFLSLAFDIAFLDKKNPKQLDWAEINFVRFANIIKESKYNDLITWGGIWADPKTDMPHFEQKNWKEMLPKN